MEGDIMEVMEMPVERLRAGDWDALVIGSEVPVLGEFVTSTCPVCATMEPAVEGVPSIMVFCKGNLVSSQVGEVYPKVLERMVIEAGEFGGMCAAKATKVIYEMSGYG